MTSARERLLDSAATLLAQRGIDVSTRAICDAAGVTAPTLYHHFADRAALLDAVVDRGFGDYLARKRSLESTGDPVEDLRRGWDDHIAWGVANPSFYALMYGQVRPGHRSVAAAEAEQLLQGKLEAAGARGLLRVPAELGMRMVMSANVGLTLQLIRDPGAARDDLSAQVRESTLEGVLLMAAQSAVEPGAVEPGDRIPPMAAADSYSYLGPAGTFTEAALAQVPEAAGKTWHAVNNVGQALDDVVTGRSVAAMIAIENTVDGGVSASQDALATIPGLRIIGEYLVSVNFVLVARPGTALADVKVINAHPVAYGQSRRWVDSILPDHGHLPATSNVAAAASLLDASTGSGIVADAAIAPPGITDHYALEVLAENIGDNPNAQTRFVLVSRSTTLPAPTGSDKTSIIAELPDDSAGRLLEMLEQFATRGVNMSLLASRPIGDSLGRYRFVIDLDGHVLDERVADALLGLKRFSPNVIFLGSYPRADQRVITVTERYDNGVFVDAREWLRGLTQG
jgi:prephenate dehydratase